MPFTNTDLYLASGTAQLKNTWVDPVYKFDSSGFYNWEQDKSRPRQAQLDGLAAVRGIGKREALARLELLQDGKG